VERIAKRHEAAALSEGKRDGKQSDKNSCGRPGARLNRATK
jgi:hypothetical protein